METSSREMKGEEYDMQDTSTIREITYFSHFTFFLAKGEGDPDELPYVLHCGLYYYFRSPLASDTRETNYRCRMFDTEYSLFC